MMIDWLRIAGLNLAVAVMLGAFGAHGLKGNAQTALDWWHTATLYLFVHALGLLALGVLERMGYRVQRAAWCLQIGVLVFSGSLYLIALGLPKWLGMVTPIGGTLMIIGWLCIALCKWQKV